MGYYTVFTLQTQPALDYVNEVQDALAKFAGGCEEYVNSGEGAKWYDHQDHMLELSRQMPDVLFILDGEGEGVGDQWRKFFRNGQAEVHRAEWTAPEKPTRV